MARAPDPPTPAPATSERMVPGLRDRVPEGLRQWLARRVEARRRAPDPRAEAAARARFGPGDFRASEEDPDAALDLLALCRRAGPRPAAR